MVTIPLVPIRRAVLLSAIKVPNGGGRRAISFGRTTQPRVGFARSSDRAVSGNAVEELRHANIWTVPASCGLSSVDLSRESAPIRNPITLAAGQFAIINSEGEPPKNELPLSFQYPARSGANRTGNDNISERGARAHAPIAAEALRDETPPPILANAVSSAAEPDRLLAPAPSRGAPSGASGTTSALSTGEMRRGVLDSESLGWPMFFGVSRYPPCGA